MTVLFLQDTGGPIRDVCGEMLTRIVLEQRLLRKKSGWES